MKANPKYLSFYYENITELPDIKIERNKTALLVVDMQKHFLAKDGFDADLFREMGEWDRWEPYFDHVEKVTIPNNRRLIECCRKNGIEVTFGRIAALKSNGADRCRVQSTVGWNNILVPVNSEGAAMMDELAPLNDEIVVNKTTFLLDESVWVVRSVSERTVGDGVNVTPGILGMVVWKTSLVGLDCGSASGVCSAVDVVIVCLTVDSFSF